MSPAAGWIRGDTGEGTGDKSTLHLGEGGSCRGQEGAQGHIHQGDIGGGGMEQEVPREQVTLQVFCI